MPYKDKAKNDACKRAWRESHRNDPIEKAKARNRKHRYYYSHAESERAKSRAYYRQNIDSMRESARAYYYRTAKEKTPEQRDRDRKRLGEWHMKHPNYHNEETIRRYHRDPSAFIIRAMVARMIKIAEIRKTCRSYRYIGCTPDFLRGWLQAKFRDGMAWDNYGRVWVVDHIKPLAAFKLRDHPERIFEASHYSNLQPLFVEENLKKGFKSR